MVLSGSNARYLLRSICGRDRVIHLLFHGGMVHPLACGNPDVVVSSVFSSEVIEDNILLSGTPLQRQIEGTFHDFSTSITLTGLKAVTLVTASYGGI